MSIVVTGSTGKLGSLIVQNLSKLTDPSSIIATTRSPSSEKAGNLAKLGVQVVSADFNDPSSLVRAVRGAEKVIIVSIDKFGDAAFEAHKAAIDAAITAGVKQIYYTSHQGSKEVSSFQPMMDHWRTESYLEGQARNGLLEFTSFRNGFYMWNLPMLTGFPRSGKISTPQDGKVSWTSHPDLAEGIAKLVLRATTDRYLTLTNTTTSTFADIATYLTEITGKEVERVIQSDEEYKKKIMAFGVPGEVVDMLLGGFKAFENGEFAETGSLLRDVLGRDCQSVQEYLVKEFGAKAGK